jgi:hypothetical protein
MMGDVNGDRKADVVGFGATGAYVALSTGSSFGSMAQWSRNFGAAPVGGSWANQDANPRMLGDVNGDSKADIVGCGALGTYYAFSTGSGFGTISMCIPQFGSAPAGGSWVSQNTYPRMVADVNGGGKGDIIGFGYNGVLVSLYKY